MKLNKKQIKELKEGNVIVLKEGICLNRRHLSEIYEHIYHQMVYFGNKEFLYMPFKTKVYE